MNLTRNRAASVSVVAIFWAGCSAGSTSGHVDPIDESTENVTLQSQNGDAAAGASPCSAPPADTIFCDDFDAVPSVSSGWTSAVSTHGKGRLGHGHFVSAPASYRAKGGYFQVLSTTGTYNPTATIDVDVRLHEVAAGGWLTLLGDATKSGQTSAVATSLSVDARGNLVVAQDDGLAPTTLPSSFAKDTWAHVQLALTTTALTVSINRVPVFNAVPASALVAGQQTRVLQLGAMAKHLTVNFDNVLFTDPAPTPPPVWTVTSCSMNTAGALQWQAIDSNGHRFFGANGGPPRAGSPPPDASTASSTLDAADLSALLGAALTLDASTAGYTTTTGPALHSSLRQGAFFSAGAPKAPPALPVLVDSFEDGVSLGHRKVVSANDPAAGVIRKYQCINFQ